MKTINFDYNKLQNALKDASHIDYKKRISADEKLQEIIKGERTPNYDEVVSICNNLGISIYDLHKPEIKKPTQLIKEADEIIIGNDQLKKDLAVTLYNHQLLANGLGGSKQVHLVVGASGTGKSFTIKKMLELSNIKYLCLDGSNITASGYKGTNLGEALLEILPPEGFNGFIIIDEIDKMVDRNWLEKSGKSIYSELLTLVENDNYVIKNVCMNLQNVSFIFMGSFEHCISKKKKNTSMSLMNMAQSKQYQITREEIVEDGGLDIELVGRINKISSTDKLTKDNVVNIIKNSSDSKYTQLKSLLKSYYNTDFIITNDVIEYMAIEAESSIYGVRTINQILSGLETDIILSCEQKGVSEMKLVLNENKIELEAKENTNQIENTCLIPVSNDYIEIKNENRYDLTRVVNSALFRLITKYQLDLDIQSTSHKILMDIRKKNEIFRKDFKIKYVPVQSITEVIFENLDIPKEDYEITIENVNKQIYKHWKERTNEY